MMLENRKTQGLTTAVASMSVGTRGTPRGVGTLKEERQMIIETTPKHAVLKEYFDKVIERECAEEDEFEE